MSFLILMNGLPATLKSTIGKKLSEQLNCKIVSTNDYGCPVNKNMDASLSKRGARYEKMFKDLEKHLKHKNNVIADASFTQAHWREYAYHLANTNKVNEIIMVRCVCDNLEILRERFLDRKINGHTEGKYLKVYYQVKGQEQLPFKDKLYNGKSLPIVCIDTQEYKIGYERGMGEYVLMISDVLDGILKEMRVKNVS